MKKNIEKYCLVLCVLFPSSLFAYDETYIQCRDDMFFKIDDREEESFFSKGDDAPSRIYNYSSSTMNPTHSESRFDDVTGSILVSNLPNPNDDWIKSAGITLDHSQMRSENCSEIGRPYAKEFCKDWEFYIDRVEGEAWFVLPEDICLDGCDSKRIFPKRNFVEERLPDRPQIPVYVKAIKFGDCKKTSKRKIKKYFSAKEEESRQKEAETKF